MLLDDALFEDGFVGVGLVVANLDALVFHLADEVVGLGLVGEVVDVFSGAILLDEVGVLQGGMELRRLGDGRHLAAHDHPFDGRPALSGVFKAALLPAAVVDRRPASGEVERPLEEVAPHMAVAQQIVPREGMGWAHGCKVARGARGFASS